MHAHIAKTVSSCFAVLRRIRSNRQSVTKLVLQSLVISMVLTRLARHLSVCLICSINFSSYYTRRPTDLLGSKVQSRNSATPRPPLVTSFGENSVPSGSACFTLPAWYCTTVPVCRAHSCGRTNSTRPWWNVWRGTLEARQALFSTAPSSPGTYSVPATLWLSSCRRCAN